MNSFIYDIFEKIAGEASKLVRYNKKHTLSSISPDRRQTPPPRRTRQARCL